MDGTRAIRLGWRVETDTTSWDEFVREYRNRLNDLREGPDAGRYLLDQLLALVWFRYVEGEDAQARRHARESVDAATFYFFGDWRSKIGSGNHRNQPPNLRWWHQGDFFKLHLCIESMTLASCIDDWGFIQRMARHILGIHWQNIRDGREENALRMALASIIVGKLPAERDVARFVKLVTKGNKNREVLLLHWLLAIAEGSDAELQSAADSYFDYFLKVESKKKAITNKIMIEGTLYVNLARHLGRMIDVPERIGERYVSFAEE